MAQYGEVRVDYITYTTGVSPEASVTVPVSGLVQNPTFSGDVIVKNNLDVEGNITISGTVTGNAAGFTSITGTTVTGTTANFVTVSGTTVTGNTGNFTTVTTTTANVTSGIFDSGTAAAPSVSVGTTDNGIYSPGTDQVAISTGGNGRVFIDSAGNVEIMQGKNLTWVYQGGSTHRARIRAESTDSLIFENGSANTERMRIDSSGNVFIGGSSNAALDGVFGLVVGGSSKSDVGVAVEAGTSQFLIYTSSTDQALNFWDARVNSMRMRIDSAGNVGIGTTSPASGLHLSGAATTDSRLTFTQTTAGLTGTVQQGSSGFEIAAAGAQSINLVTNGTERARIDSSGRLLVGTSSSTGSHKLEVNGGTDNEVIKVESSDAGAYIRFEDDDTTGQIRLGAIDNDFKIDVNGSERMRIDSSGNINVMQNQAVFRISSQSGYIIPMVARNTGNNINQTMIEFRGWNNSVTGGISTRVNVTTYSTSSDYRLKENVAILEGGIDRVKQLQPKTFNFIDAPETRLNGFLAHEVQEIVPEAVTGVKDGVEDIGTVTDENGVVLHEEVPNYSGKPEGQTWTATGTRMVTQGIDQSKLVPLLTAALQEAIAKIETLETKVAALEAG